MKFRLTAADSSILNVSCLKDLGFKRDAEIGDWIEIESIEDLLNLGIILDERLIIYPPDEKDPLPQIQIYNDYIE